MAKKREQGRSLFPKELNQGVRNAGLKKKKPAAKYQLSRYMLKSTTSKKQGLNFVFLSSGDFNEIKMPSKSFSDKISDPSSISSDSINGNILFRKCTGVDSW